MSTGKTELTLTSHQIYATPNHTFVDLILDLDELAKDSKFIKAFKNEEFKSLHFEQKHSNADKPIFSARETRSDRFLTYIEDLIIEGKTYRALIITEKILNHDYKNAKSFNKNCLNKHFSDNEEIFKKLIKKTLPNLSSEAKEKIHKKDKKLKNFLVLNGKLVALSEEQAKIPHNKSALVIGAAGTGKTLVSQHIAETIANTEQHHDNNNTPSAPKKVLIITLSKNVAMRMKKLQTNPNIDVKAFSEFFTNLDLIPEKQFNEWLISFKDKEKSLAKIQNTSSILQSFNRETLQRAFRSLLTLDSSEKTQQFMEISKPPYSIEERTLFLKALTSYQGFLKEKNLIDEAVSPIPDSFKKQYDAIIFDEAHDGNSHQIDEVLSLLKNKDCPIFFCISNHQNFKDAFSKIEIIKYLSNIDIIYKLQGSYRCPENIAVVANLIQKIRFQILGGALDTYEEPYLTSKTGKKGSVTWFDSITEFDKLYPNPTQKDLDEGINARAHITVIAHDIDAAKKALPHCKWYFTPEDSKGLEFECVAALDILSHKNLAFANSFDKTKFKEKIFRTKEETSVKEIGATSAVYTTFTRSERDLLVIQSPFLPTQNIIDYHKEEIQILNKSDNNILPIAIPAAKQKSKQEQFIEICEHIQQVDCKQKNHRDNITNILKPFNLNFNEIELDNFCQAIATLIHSELLDFTEQSINLASVDFKKACLNISQPSPVVLIPDNPKEEIKETTFNIENPVMRSNFPPAVTQKTKTKTKKTEATALLPSKTDNQNKLKIKNLFRDATHLIKKNDLNQLKILLKKPENAESIPELFQYKSKKYGDNTLFHFVCAQTCPKIAEYLLSYHRKHLPEFVENEDQQIPLVLFYVEHKNHALINAFLSKNKEQYLFHFIAIELWDLVEPLLNDKTILYKKNAKDDTLLLQLIPSRFDLVFKLVMHYRKEGTLNEQILHMNVVKLSALTFARFFQNKSPNIMQCFELFCNQIPKSLLASLQYDKVLLWHSINRDYRTDLKNLLTNTHNLNDLLEPDFRNTTPLMHAIIQNKPECAIILIPFDNIHQTDESGKNALILAAENYIKNNELIFLLIDKYNINEKINNFIIHKNESWYNLLELAIKHNDDIILKKLLDYPLTNVQITNTLQTIALSNNMEILEIFIDTLIKKPELINLNEWLIATCSLGKLTIASKVIAMMDGFVLKNLDICWVETLQSSATDEEKMNFFNLHRALANDWIQNYPLSKLKNCSSEIQNYFNELKKDKPSVQLLSMFNPKDEEVKSEHLSEKIKIDIS